MSNAIRVKFTGDRAMKKNLESVAREFPIAARRGTREWAQEFLSEIIPGVPFKTGRLAGSGKVRISIGKKAGKENIAASIVFTAPHARIVHETHKTQSKFLERPLLQKVPTAGAEIAEKIAIKKAALK